jgi:hypothetical protein
MNKLVVVSLMEIDGESLFGKKIKSNEQTHENKQYQINK